MSRQNPLFIGMSAVNLGFHFDREVVKDYIAKNNCGVTLYELVPRGTGLRAAAIDWWLLVSRVADLAGVLSMLWLTYEKFIQPKRQTNESGDIYVVIMSKDAVVFQTKISEFKDKRSFIETVQPLIESYRSSRECGEFYQYKLFELQNDHEWVPRVN